MISPSIGALITGLVGCMANSPICWVMWQWESPYKYRRRVPEDYFVFDDVRTTCLPRSLLGACLNRLI